MSEAFSSPFFGIFLTVLTYEFGVWLYRKTKLSLFNPLLISVLLCILFLVLTKIPLTSYQIGGNMIVVFLGPATAVLALSIYTRLSILKKHLVPVLAGTLVGSVVSVSTVLVLCQIFHMDEVLTRSLIPKSVTTPFAIGISDSIGGNSSISVAAVVMTGILGASLAPFLIRLLKIRNPIAAGVAIGTASHAAGTAKALEIGETEGAMSGVAIGLSGVFTVILSVVIDKILL